MIEKRKKISSKYLQNWKNGTLEVEQNVPIELDEPLVLIYNTHNAETYKPTFGTSKEEGKIGT